MESDPNQMSQSAPLCRSGCGFYGNPSNDGLCSKCYKDALKRKQAAPTTTTTTTTNASSNNNNNNSNSNLNNESGGTNNIKQSLIVSSTTNTNINNNNNTSSNTNNTSSTTNLTSSNNSNNLNVSAINAQDSSQSSDVEAKVITIIEGQPNSTSTSNTTAKLSEINTSTNTTPSSTTTTTEDTPTKSQKKKKMRCPICRTSLGIIRFECRCGGFFCGTHRYANMHNCQFDYKEHGAEEIRKNNPQVIGEKVQKI